MSEKRWELPKKLQDLWDNNSACKTACQKVVEEAIRHYENALIVEEGFWSQVFEHFKLDRNKHIYHFDGTHVVQGLEVVKDPEQMKVIRKLDERISHMQQARKQAAEALQMPKENNQ